MSTNIKRPVHMILPRELSHYARDRTTKTILSTTANESTCQFPSCGRVFRKGTKTAFEHVCQHLGFKPYVCTCGQEFQHCTSARRHCHTQVSSFSCDSCGRAFRRKDARNTHQLRCHPALGLETSVLSKNVGNRPVDVAPAPENNMFSNDAIGNHCGNFPAWDLDEWSYSATGDQPEANTHPSVSDLFVLGPYDFSKDPEFQKLFLDTVNH